MPVSRMQQRRDTTARWTSANPVLLDGELGYDTTLERYKVGDGVAVWSALPWSDRLEDTQAAATQAQAAAVASQAAAADAVDISNISTSDDVVEALLVGTAGAGPKTRNALSASIDAVTAPLIDPKAWHTWAWLGDSISNFLGLTADGDRQATRSASGYGAWADVFTGHRTDTLINASTVGHTTAQMLARVGQVIATHPATCHVLGGTNDVGNLVPLATATANLTAIYDALETAGIRVVAGTIPPQSTYPAGQRDIHDGINAFIRGLATTRPSVIVVDYNAVLEAPSVGGVPTDGTWAFAENTYDGIHPSVRGAAQMGRALAAVIQRVIPARSVLPLPFYESDPTALKATRFLAAADAPHNPGPGLGISWVGTPGTLDYVPRTDGIAGSRWRVTIPPGDNGADIIMNADPLPIGTPGTAVEAAIEYYVSGIQAPAWNATPQVGWQLWVQGFAGGFTGLRAQDLAYYVDAPPGANTPGNFPTFSHGGVLRTPPHVTTATATLVQACIQLRGGMTMDFDRFIIRKATQPVVVLAR